MRRSVILFLFIALLLSACARPVNTDLSVNEKIQANNIGNTNNNGSFYLYNDVLYGRIVRKTDGNGFFCLSKQSVKGGETTVLADWGDVSNITIWGEHIYFLDTASPEVYQQALYGAEDRGAIYRVDLNGNGLKRITEELVSRFYIYGGEIYYQVGTYEVKKEGYKNIYSNERTTIYRASLEGGEKREVYTYNNSENPINGFFSMNNDILFMTLDSSDIVSVSIADRGVRTHIISVQIPNISSISSITPVGNSLFFIATINEDAFSSESFIFVYDPSTDSVKQAIDDSVYCFTSSDDFLYYYDGQYIKQFLLKTGETEIIAEAFCVSIEIIGDYLYYLVPSRNDMIFYRVSIIDGSITQVA